MGNDGSKSSKSSTQTRIDRDIVEVAAVVADLEQRSTRGQINHWTRIGMQVERSGSVNTRRVRDVATGRAQFSALTDEERAAAHALIDADIAERAVAADFGAAARAAGVASVSLDEDGNLIETAPDGSVTRL